MVGRWRNLERTWRVSWEREGPCEASQRGEKGRRVVPMARRVAGMSWSRRGRRKENSESIFLVP